MGMDAGKGELPGGPSSLRFAQLRLTRTPEKSWLGRQELLGAQLARLSSAPPGS